MKEVNDCFTSQCTKGQKYGKLPAMVSEEIPRNTLLVYIIDNTDLNKIPIYIIPKRGETLRLKSVTLTQ